IMPVQQHLDQRPHYEILLGISDELGGNQALGNFIQAAEHHNRMPAIDRWVIQNSFDWLAHHEDMVSDISTFTINLSGQSLNNEELIDFIYQEVSRSSVPIENICFEVTETAGVTNLSDTADFIETIKGTGCKFALDDFGTGMSSYSYLKSLPVDYLKIDGTFIKDIINNRNDYAVVKSICEIGHFMEKRVIAEFVQDEQSSKLLKEIGIDFLQGYGIEKPHKLDELIR
ncbi:MAG: EAL domain-containing protein, partial [Thioalkalispiraceae bacterium]